MLEYCNINKSMIDKVLQLMLDYANQANTNLHDLINDVLDKMLAIATESSMTNPSINKWTLRCIKKDANIYNDDTHKIDLYQPISDEAKDICNSLNIKCFAFQYTVKPLNELQQLLHNPLSSKHLMSSDISCKLLALDNNYRIIEQFNYSAGHIKPGKNKHEFVFLQGTWPELVTPSQTYNEQQFIETANTYLPNNMRTPDVTRITNAFLQALYKLLKMHNEQQLNFADILTQQLMSHDQSFITVFGNFIKSIFSEQSIQQCIDDNINYNNDSKIKDLFTQHLPETHSFKKFIELLTASAKSILKQNQQ